jgi:hypothetical protein
MTSEEFQQQALSLAGVRFENKLGVMSFTISGKTFATLGSPDPAWAMVKLTPEEQGRAIAAAPNAFSTQPGGAGARGWTCLRLAAVEARVLLPYLRSAKAKAGNAKSVRTVLRG